jgi:hypothetical protein
VSEFVETNRDGMIDSDDFSHGSFGDYSGAVFHGPPRNGFWLDRFAVSSRFIDPLFAAVIDRYGRWDSVPRLIQEWNTLTGWMDSHRPEEISRLDALSFLEALAGLSEDDIARQAPSMSIAEALRCSVAIRGFIVERLNRDDKIYVERE